MLFDRRADGPLHAGSGVLVEGHVVRPRPRQRTRKAFSVVDGGAGALEGGGGLEWDRRGDIVLVIAVLQTSAELRARFGYSL